MADQLVVTAYVQVRDAKGQIEGVGHYRFVTLPRIGEIVHLGTDGGDIVIRVTDLDHTAYAAGEMPIHDSVLLTGRIEK